MLITIGAQRVKQQYSLLDKKYRKVEWVGVKK